jgi:hypothetical protein
MKAGRQKLFWKILVLVILVVAAVLLLRPGDNRGAKLVAETRQALRQEGFKTDLTDFDFSTSTEMRQREAALQALGIPPQLRRISPNLMETVNSNSAVVVWKGDSLKMPSARWPSSSDELSWEEFREQLKENKPALDGACEAILSGPIRFNVLAGNGNARLGLALVRGLADALCNRAMLDLHDGNKDSAWTNLMAATRLATACEPEPVEVSHFVRFVVAKEVFSTTWQALQADGWSDAQLARLQQEWEGLDLFTNLPEIAAFTRANDADQAARNRDMMLKSRGSIFQFAIQLLRSPMYISAALRARSDESDYLRHGWFDDQKDLMLYNRDWEVQLRKAVQSPTWARMQQLPGVTNQVPFQSKFPRSRVQLFVSMRQLPGAPAMRGGGLLGRAADTEAERRILVTAVALERYRGKHGSYPSALAALAPDYLKTVPMDFMDGQALRYRLRDDGHFLLYSVGLDCADDGGQIVSEARPGLANSRATDFNALPAGDIVWPFPASMAAVDARRQQQLAVLRSSMDQAADSEAMRQWALTARNQAAAEKLLAFPPVEPADSDFHGHPLSQVLCNTNSTGTNRLTLGQMLTLKQIVTGGEPETITFELPVNYDVLTNIGGLMLFIDMNSEYSDVSPNVQQLECNRATNGDCLLVWSTIYESPGRHGLAAGVFLKEQEPNFSVTTGPLAPFTVTNLCQFSIGSAHFDPRVGAIFCARLPEANGSYVARLTSTNGNVLKTVVGSTTNGVFNFLWDLMDEQGRRCTDGFFNSEFHITLPDSGRSQVLRGP